jgi:predicted dehydrogenase
MKVAVIGCGYWGRNLVRNFHELGALAVVADATPAGRALARSIAPGVTTTDDVEEVLQSSVDGIVIATPAETHHALVGQALNAGKDVFVEKPLALTYEQGVELLDRANAAERMLMVGHVLEYHPAIRVLDEMVHSGELGRLQYMYSTRLSLGKVRREENILWSFAPHDVAIMLRFAGHLPLQVAACGGSYLQPNIADVTVTNLLFPDGVRAHIHVSWLHPFKEQRLVIVGSRRMATFDDVAKQLLVYDQRVEFRDGEAVPIKGAGQPVAFASDEPLKLECMAFLDAIATRRPPRTDGASGVRVLEVLGAAQQSLERHGEPTSLPHQSRATSTSLR